MVARVEIRLSLDANGSPEKPGKMNCRRLKAFAGHNYTDNNRRTVSARFLPIFL